MNREQGLQEIEKTRIVTIIRGVDERHIESVAEALNRGGVTVLEVTLNTPGAPEMISLLNKKFGERMFVGAGTVLDLDDAKQALQAGASFLVTPNTDEEVIRYAAGKDIPIFPGAMTPTEIVKAWKAGATAVKIFPGASLGFNYFKELQGPLRHIPMVAVGGVNEDNIGQFLQAGCYAVGIGGSLIDLRQIADANYDWVENKAKRLLDKVKEAL